MVAVGADSLGLVSQAELKGAVAALKESATRAQAKADELAAERRDLGEKVRELTAEPLRTAQGRGACCR